MAQLTKQARRQQRREARRQRFQRWIERHIVAEDPNPGPETNEGIHGLWFALFVLLGAGVYLSLGWYIFSR
jgi:hypothetical protein